MLHGTQHSAVLALALVVLIAGCGGDDPESPNSESSRLQSAEDAQPPDCGIINLVGDDYGTKINPSSGPSGTEVVLSGTTVRGEDGRWAASDRLEAWWNTQVPESEVPIHEGPTVQLVEIDNMERCRFEASFMVPDAEPGRYQISVFTWEEDPTEGYGLFLPHYFTVTRD